MEEIEKRLEGIQKTAKAIRQELDGKAFRNDITTVGVENIISLVQEALRELAKEKNEGKRGNSCDTTT
jgi:hypothetical protein